MKKTLELITEPAVEPTVELTTFEKSIVEQVNTNKLTDLESAIIARSESLNIPALAAFFMVTEDTVKNALAKK